MSDMPEERETIIRDLTESFVRLIRSQAALHAGAAKLTNGDAFNTHAAEALSDFAFSVERIQERTLGAALAHPSQDTKERSGTP